jgi:hypothetical protein
VTFRTSKRAEQADAAAKYLHVIEPKIDFPVAPNIITLVIIVPSGRLILSMSSQLVGYDVRYMLLKAYQFVNGSSALVKSPCMLG